MIIDKGWECPKCGRVYAPWVAQCNTCSWSKTYIIRNPYDFNNEDSKTGEVSDLVFRLGNITESEDSK